MDPLLARVAASAAPAVPAVRSGVGRAHGKAILLGEHAVVYGAPAIALPVHALEAVVEVGPDAAATVESDLYTGPADAAPSRLGPVVTALRAAARELGGDPAARLVVRSTIPHERGLGSSAAVAAAVVHAVAAATGSALDPALRHALVQEAERVAHGTPSGLDARAVVADGPIRFLAGEVTPVAVGAPLAFVLADTGVPGSTAEAVESVRALRATHPRTVDGAVARLTDIAEGSVADLAAGDRDALGARLGSAHEILALLGVSSPALDGLVRAAHAAGSPGAKLTGGGLGGCVLALAPSPDGAADLARALTTAGAARVWTTTLEPAA